MEQRNLSVAVFPSRLGWMGAIWLDTHLKFVTFGHRQAAAVVERFVGEPGLSDELLQSLRHILDPSRAAKVAPVGGVAANLQARQDVFLDGILLENVGSQQIVGSTLPETDENVRSSHPSRGSRTGDAQVEHAGIGEDEIGEADVGETDAERVEGREKRDGRSQATAEEARWQLVKRLQAFAEGAADDFLDVPVAMDAMTPFQRRVIAACRAIPAGETISYAELAERAGSPRAARAVGNVMARNRLPLIIPCHRVVGSGGGLGGYSAPDGLTMKQRLLQQEALDPTPPASRRQPEPQSQTAALSG